MNIRCTKLTGRILGASMLSALLAAPAVAMPVAGVDIPDTAQADGSTLVLNGAGIRTFSMLGVRVYVAGLYLPERSQDAEAILASPGKKMLLLRFLRDVPVEKVRSAWTEGLTNNCVAPCVLSAGELSRFLGFLTGMKQGETVTLVFTGSGAQAYFNGKLGGTVTDPQFAHLMLAMFLGPHPSSAELKADLLGTAH